MARGRVPRLARAYPQAAGTATVLIARYFPWLSGGALTGAAFFHYPGKDFVLVGLMLFLPLVDRAWRLPGLLPRRSCLLLSLALAASAAALLVWKPSYLSYGLTTLFLAALPEEWFFRAYFMSRLGDGHRANVVASLLFSLIHGMTRGWVTAGLVFVPSLFYGWIYQRTRDLSLLVLVHALSNLVYAVFLSGFVATWAPGLR